MLENLNLKIAAQHGERRPQAFLVRMLGIDDFKKKKTRRGSRGGRTRRRPLYRGNLLHLGLINAQSMTNKSAAILTHIAENDLDALAVTESWLRQQTGSTDILSTIPDGFSAFQVPRCDGRMGGGIALILRSTFTVLNRKQVKYVSFELIDVVISHESSSFRLLII